MISACRCRFRSAGSPFSAASRSLRWHPGRYRAALQSHSGRAVRPSARRSDLARNAACAGKQTTARAGCFSVPLHWRTAHLVRRLAPLSEKNDIRVYAKSVASPAGCPRASHRWCSGDGRGDRRARACARVPGTVVAPGLAARIRPAGRPATEGAGPVGGTQRTWRDGRGRQDPPLRAASAGPPSWPYAEMG